MHKFDLNNKFAIITGGAQGFGLDIAKRFIQSGSKVRIWDIDEKQLKDAFDQINNVNLEYDVVDVSDFNQVKETVEKIAKNNNCLLYTSPSPRDLSTSRMPSSA